MLPQPIFIAIAVVAALASQVVSGQNSSISSNSPSSFSSSISPISISPTVTMTVTSSNSSSFSTSTTSTTKKPTTATGTTKKSTTATGTTKKSTSTTGKTRSTPPTTTGTSTKEKTCGSISFVINSTWNASYASSNSMKYKNMNTSIYSLVRSLYNDANKYGDLRLSNFSLNEETGKVMLSFRLCMVFKKADNGFIEDILMEGLKNGRWFQFRLIESSVKLKAFGVKFTNWKAKDGECKKCSQGGGGPLEIEAGKCEPEAGYSCAGLKTTKKVNECVKYCDSSAAVATISSFALTLGILVSVSFYVWK